MKKLAFIKMVASGNDFVVIDNRDRIIDPTPAWVRRICERRLGVGADGVLIIEPSKIADFKMRIVNADGSEAEMCGNGARCAAKFARMKKIADSQMCFETIAGVIIAKVIRSQVKVKLTDPIDLILNKELTVDDHQLTVHCLNTGVPHTVLIVEDIEEVKVRELGHQIRWHPAFAPAGSNVNFIQIIDEQSIKIRTYERGVEDETLACGTGSAASACLACLLGLVKPPVKMLTRGGEVLEIGFDKIAGRILHLYLSGRVQVVYWGQFM